MMREHKYRAWSPELKRMMYRGLHDKNWYYTEKNDEHGTHLARAVHQRDIHTLKIMESLGKKTKMIKKFMRVIY